MEEESMELDLGRYADIVRRWLWLIVLGTMLAGVAALVVSLLLPPVYEAEADVASVKSFSQISLSPDYKTLSEAQMTQGLNIADRQKALVAIARGSDVAASVIADLGDSLTEDERQVAKILNTVNVSTDGDLIRIKVQNKDPQKAAKIADAWARVYAARVNSLYTESPTSLDQVQAQANQSWQNYQTAESALNQFIGQNRIDVINSEVTAKQNAIGDLYATERNLERILQDARSLQDLMSKDASLTSSDAGSRLAALLIRANAATLSYSSSPLQLQITSASLDDPTLSNLHTQIDSLISTLQARQKQVESQIADPALQSQILALQKEQEQQMAKKQELTAARDLAWSTYKTLASKVEEVRVTEQSNSTIVREAGSAVVPSQPIAPKKTTNTLLAAVVGLMLAVGIAFAVEFLDPSVRSSQELAHDLNVPVFEVPSRAGSPSSLHPSSFILHPSSPIPHPFYELWANLFLSAQPSGKVLLAANLGRERDGGSVIANLGMVAAQAGRSVILVDSNVHRPSLNQLFGIPNTRGWSNLLADEHPDIASYLQPTSVKNLTVLTSGNPSDSDEWIVSPRLAFIVSILRERADLVLFTSASPSLAADALLIGKQADGVVLLVAQRVTPRPAVLQFAEQLHHIGTRVLGVILFQAQEGGLAQFRHLVSLIPRQRAAQESISPVSSDAHGEA